MSTCILTRDRTASGRRLRVSRICVALFCQWLSAVAGSKGRNREREERLDKGEEDDFVFGNALQGAPWRIRQIYTRSLRFEDRPDYVYLRGLFRRSFESNGFGARQ